MALFVLTGTDHKNALAHRMEVRPRHLAYAAEHAAMIKVAGPLLDDEGQMAGSLFIIEAADKAEVEAFSAADPYRSEGVFETVEIRGFRVATGALP